MLSTTLLNLAATSAIRMQVVGDLVRVKTEHTCLKRGERWTIGKIGYRTDREDGCGLVSGSESQAAVISVCNLRMNPF